MSYKRTDADNTFVRVKKNTKQCLVILPKIHLMNFTLEVYLKPKLLLVPLKLTLKTKMFT